jgi:hypothetical protein
MKKSLKQFFAFSFVILCSIFILFKFLQTKNPIVLTFLILAVVGLLINKALKKHLIEPMFNSAFDLINPNKNIEFPEWITSFRSFFLDLAILLVYSFIGVSLTSLWKDLDSVISTPSLLTQIISYDLALTSLIIGVTHQIAWSIYKTFTRD